MTFYWYNNKVISLPPTLCCPRPLPYHGFHQLQLFLPGNMRSLNSVEPRLSATSSSPSSNPGHANPTPNVTALTARDPWVLQQLAQGAVYPGSGQGQPPPQPRCLTLSAYTTATALWRERRTWPTFLPNTTFQLHPPPRHPGGLWEGLRHLARAAASQATTLHLLRWWAQPCLPQV